MSLYDIRTAYTPAIVAHDVPRRAFTPPTLTPAEMALRENRAVLASWDRQTGRFSCNREAVAARRVAWLADLPAGRFGRDVARSTWDLTDGAADSRVDTLERAGMLIRVQQRPIMWEKRA